MRKDTLVMLSVAILLGWISDAHALHLCARADGQTAAPGEGASIKLRAQCRGGEVTLGTTGDLARLAALDDLREDVDANTRAIEVNSGVLVGEAGAPGSSEEPAREQAFPVTTGCGLTVTADGAFFDVCNVYVRSGLGATGSGTNGKGNLIVGYDENDFNERLKTGSHNLVVGPNHEYTSFGGVVFGSYNRVEGIYATVTGGKYNEATGELSAVSGGAYNDATGMHAVVSSGVWGRAVGTDSWVAGGSGGDGAFENEAAGEKSSVVGGWDNTATGDSASIFGGNGNLASGVRSTVSGGEGNTAEGDHSGVYGGNGNLASAGWSVVVGGQNNLATEWYYSTVAGGAGNTASGAAAAVSGGYDNNALGNSSSVSGGESNTASGYGSSILGGENRSVTNDFEIYPPTP